LQASELESRLRDLFIGKSFTIRSFYRGTHLTYGADGRLTSKSEPGDWSRDGMVQISSIKVAGDGLLMKGKRTCIFFNQTDGTFGNLQTGDQVEIEVRLSPDRVDLEPIILVLKKVFLNSEDRLSDLVPQYWANCLAQKANRPDRNSPWECALPNAESVPNFTGKNIVWDEPPKDVSLLNGMQLYIVRHRIGYLLEPGMNLPIVQLASDPRFEWAQRRTKLDGKLVLSFDISEDGQTKSLLIVSPMGMGVDDEAARTVSSWRFKPARCSDRPCAVHARVAFDFTPLFSNRPLN